MKKIFNKQMIICFILGGIIFGSIGVYAATTYTSNLILYKTSDADKPLNEVLDDLYSIKTKGNATAEDIVSGKTAIVQGKLVTGTASNGIHIVNLGSGSTFNVSSYEGYKKFTKDNFLIVANSYGFSGSCQGFSGGNGSNSGNVGFSKSYNASTGILTVSGARSIDMTATDNYSWWLRGTTSISVSVYLVY